MYLDDIFHSEGTVEDAVLVREDWAKVLGGADFRAQKWCSSQIEVLEMIPQEDRITGVKLDDWESPSVKIWESIGMQMTVLLCVLSKKSPVLLHEASPVMSYC